MNYPNFREERRLWRKGYKYVVGLDEAGRGPLAGPVVAAAALIEKHKLQAPNYKQIPITKIQNLKQKGFGHLTIGNSNLFGICNATLRGVRFASREFGISKLRDSKRLSPGKREKIYKILVNHPNIEWGTGRVSEKVIDKINILEATKLAMERAVKNLEKKIGKRADFLILDGNFAINLDRPQESIIKADEKVFLCVIAGIIAKVVRDRIMLRYHKKYPYYGFDRHKGYPTRFHRDMIKKNGFCPFHRKSFKIS